MAVGVMHDLGVTALLMLFRLTKDPHGVLILLSAGLSMSEWVSRCGVMNVSAQSELMRFDLKVLSEETGKASRMGLGSD